MGRASSRDTSRDRAGYIGVVIPRVVKDALVEQARRDDLTLSDVVRRVLRRAAVEELPIGEQPRGRA